MSMQTRKWSLEGALKWKNLLGYGETWDGTGCYGLDTTSEVGVGLNYPRFRGWLAALQVRASHLTQDWSKCSSYKERLLGFSVGLVSDECHDVSYNLTWRDLRDPSRVGSQAVRQQLGHSLLSSVKYAFKLDRRNSALRPTKGFAFASTTQVAGLGFDSRLLRFVRQVRASHGLDRHCLRLAFTFDMPIKYSPLFDCRSWSSGGPSRLAS